MNQQSRPNIVLILMDNLGSSDIGPYGAQDIHTPNLDRLADEGVRLTQCYSNAPVCTPSRAALLTGLYPARAGLESNVQRDEPEKGLSLSQTTMAQMLKDNGYATAIFGKWHLGF
ncbi:MAG: sulfatase-like hydrolase/transferase, partial [SAR202 cluster bacterium]|nr:sulfatase-like hydrolase/transferase [SAR202 cluster bacterium]